MCPAASFYLCCRSRVSCSTRPRLSVHVSNGYIQWIHHRCSDRFNPNPSRAYTPCDAGVPCTVLDQIYNLHSTTYNRLSAIGNRLSAIGNRQLAIGYRQCTALVRAKPAHCPIADTTASTCVVEPPIFYIRGGKTPLRLIISSLPISSLPRLIIAQRPSNVYIHPSNIQHAPSHVPRPTSHVKQMSHSCRRSGRPPPRQHVFIK